jgi:hypothetical protein
MWSRVALAAGHPLCHFVTRSVHFGHLGRPCTPLHHLTQSAVASSPPSLCLNREREREIGIFWDLLSVASPALSSHGGTRLDPFQGHTGPSIKPREPEIHDGGVPNVPASPVLAEGYMVAFVAIYYQAFGVPSYRFLHSLL